MVPSTVPLPKFAVSSRSPRISSCRRETACPLDRSVHRPSRRRTPSRPAAFPFEPRIPTGLRELPGRWDPPTIRSRRNKRTRKRSKTARRTGHLVRYARCRCRNGSFRCSLPVQRRIGQARQCPNDGGTGLRQASTRPTPASRWTQLRRRATRRSRGCRRPTAASANVTAFPNCL